jgi:hypothetical protein
MKKFNLLALALAIGTMSLFATTNEVPDIPVKVIGNQVSDLFKTPNFNIEKDCNLKIIFTFNSEGEILVHRVYSIDKNKIDKEVLDYIYKTMDHKMIQYPGELNRAFTLPLKIKREYL